jgi:hypothetical protein
MVEFMHKTLKRVAGRLTTPESSLAVAADTEEQAAAGNAMQPESYAASERAILDEIRAAHPRGLEVVLAAQAFGARLKDFEGMSSWSRENPDSMPQLIFTVPGEPSVRIVATPQSVTKKRMVIWEADTDLNIMEAAIDLELLLAKEMDARTGVSDDEMDAYMDRQGVVLDHALALDGEGEQVRRIRLKALQLCHSGQVEVKDGAFGECTNQLLAAKIIRSALSDLTGQPVPPRAEVNLLAAE